MSIHLLHILCGELRFVRVITNLGYSFGDNSYIQVDLIYCICNDSANNIYTQDRLANSGVQYTYITGIVKTILKRTIHLFVYVWKPYM